MKKRRKKSGAKSGEVDFLTLIMSIIFALVWMVAGEFLYSSFHGVLWTPLLIGLYFLGLALMQFLSIQFCGMLRGRYAQGKYVQKAFVMILAVFVAAVGLDYIYEIVSFRDKGPSSLIFLIDDSVSMNENWLSYGVSKKPNDPDFKRIDAILDVMDSCDDDFPFAVYDFKGKDTSKQQIPMTPASKARSIDFDFFGGDGQTYIFDAMNHILDDLETGKLPDAGERPRIVLLTDGGSSDAELLQKTVTRATEKGVSICSVGFGETDDALLQGIADGANGVYVHSGDVTNLSASMLEAASAVLEEQHNLLNYREKLNNDWVYFLIRMVFVLVLGCMFLYIKAQLLRTNVQDLNVLPIHIILLIVGGLTLEIGINVFELDEVYMHGLMCVLFLINVTGVGNAPRPKPQFDQFPANDDSPNFVDQANDPFSNF